MNLYKSKSNLNTVYSCNSGITLISLTVTVMVLLILAGVGIYGFAGENNIITNALKTKKMSEVKSEEEIIELSIVEAINNNKYGDLIQDELQKLLAFNFKDRKTGLYRDENNYIFVLDEGKRYYTISFEGKIISYTDVDLNNYDVQKLATGIYGAKAEDGTVTIINTALNKISYAKLWTGEIAEDFASGDGSEENPYTIETAEQLAFLAKYTNDGNTTQGKYFELKSDIVLNWNVLDDDFNLNAGDFNVWTPIGDTEAHQFKGFFDGDNNIISGVYCIYNNNNYKGLFGVAGPLNYNCFLKRIGVVDSYLRGYRAGGIVGYSLSRKFDNCYFSGNVGNTNYHNGIVAVIRGGYTQNTFIEGVSKTDLYWIGTSVSENYYISSYEYTLPDFIKDYMQ